MHIKPTPTKIITYPTKFACDADDDSLSFGDRSYNEAPNASNTMAIIIVVTHTSSSGFDE